jgi:uncharacterized protein (TIRG00374 family)
MGLGKHKVRLGVGIAIGIFFMFLALRKVDFGQMSYALKTANYWYLLPTVPIVFFSHFLRALRWRYLLDPIKRLDTESLFSSLIIGYMANALMPAHLGEILRAYVLSKKRSIAGSSTFATIVMERIIDVFTLLALMVLAILIYPFPAWVKHSGYVMFAGTLGLLVFLVLLKKLKVQMQKLLAFLLSRFPKRFQQKLMEAAENFVSGIVPLKCNKDYVIVAMLSLFIWICYGLVFYFSLHAFNFISTYHLPWSASLVLLWSASLVLLVVTTISVVIPSSPGYVGTYHYLCQITLALFWVPAGPALSFAAVVHGINFFPVLGVGLVLSYYEGVSLSKISKKKPFADNLPQPA